MLGHCPGPVWDDQQGFSLCVRQTYTQPAPALFLTLVLLSFAALRAWQYYSQKQRGFIRLEPGAQLDISLTEEQSHSLSPAQKAENMTLEQAMVDEELSVLDSLNLRDPFLVVDPPTQDAKSSLGAAALLIVSWAIPLVLVASTTQHGHPFAPLLAFSSSALAAWLSIAIRRHTEFLGMFTLVAIYSTLQSITAFAELRATSAVPDAPRAFDAIFLFLSVAQLLLSVAVVPADKSVQDRLKRRSPIAPPELTRPSLLSIGYLSFMFGTIKRAAASVSDVEPPLLTPDLSTASIMARFRALGQIGGLRKRLLRFLFVDWTLQVLWSSLASLISVGPLFLMRALLTELSKDSHDSFKAGIFALLIPSCQALKAVFDGMALIKGRHMCVKAKSICSGEIYAKTLRRQDVAKPADDNSSSSAGRISNMVSADVAQISESFAYLHFLFPSLPIVVGVDLWLLFDTLGKSAFIGLAVLVLLLPFQFVIGRTYTKFTQRLLAISDKRLHLLQEVLHSIRLIRFFAWQDSFAERLAKVRKDETNTLLKRSYLDTSAEIIYMSNAACIGILTFYFHTQVFHRPLSASSAFTTLAAFDMLKHPMELFADLLAFIFQANASLHRIADYLEEQDTAKWDEVQGKNDNRVGFSHARFDWGSDDTFALRDLDVTFPEGKLSLVAGTVGAGKSALLLSLLGELRMVQGKRYLPSDLLPEDASTSPDGLTRSVAYCAQTAFLLSDSVRNNILFGAPWNEERYVKVLQQCALAPDLKQLPSGDQTLVGERGTVLSGGQKMRVALARALYSSCRTILLDDVLAAVDAQTAHLLVRTLSGELTRNRTCILVTHSLPLCLPSADHVVVLDNGRVQFSGPPSEASQHLGIELQQPQTENAPLGEAHLTQTETEVDLTRTAEASDEVRSEGAVSWDVYKFYLAARGNAFTWAAVICGFAFAQLFDVLSSAWLAKWANSYSNPAAAVSSVFSSDSWTFKPWSSEGEKGPDYYMKIYLTLSVGYIIILACRSATFRISSVFAARRVYDRLSASVLGAQMRFFDTTPVGQIVNRMSRDTKVVDSEIGSRMNWLFYEIAAFGSVLLAITLALPQFLFVAALTAVVYVLTIRLYLRGSREFKRLESVSRSPIFSLFGETMTGSITIRAYGATSRFLRKSLDLQNENGRPFYTLWLANRWLSVTTELQSAVTVLGIALGIVFAPGISSATAGFCLSLGLRLPERLLWVGRLGADVEIAANSVERVKEYMHLPQEEFAGANPPDNWPSGKEGIKVKDLEAFYGPGQDAVLKKVSFDIAPGSKVAIVGRTGSGKSTLALAFFRFIMTSGLVEIDGLDIQKLALNEVRRRFTIIAQDATLFSGTIRTNLDPFGEYEDAKLWDVLHRVKLSAPSRTSSSADVSEADREGSEDTLVNDKATPVSSLEQEIAEGGNNLSQGQRQLVALARGLLKLSKSKLLILDEASASLDAETDNFIQKTLREELTDATLICIAHRLDTIIDYDKVLVLGDGQVLEYDSPAALLEDDRSHFYKLCMQAGETEFARLKSLTNSTQQ